MKDELIKSIKTITSKLIDKEISFRFHPMELFSIQKSDEFKSSFMKINGMMTKDRFEHKTTFVCNGVIIHCYCDPQVG